MWIWHILTYKKALEIDPDNRDVKPEYKELEEKMNVYNKNDAKFCVNMFSKLLPVDSKDIKSFEPVLCNSLQHYFYGVIGGKAMTDLRQGLYSEKKCFRRLFGW